MIMSRWINWLFPWLAPVSITIPGGPGGPNCTGYRRHQIVTITAMGAIGLGCPVAKIHGFEAMVFGWNNDCNSQAIPVSLHLSLARGTIMAAARGTQYDRYFGLIKLDYETAPGQALQFQKQDDAEFRKLSPSQDRFVILKIKSGGQCRFYPVLLNDDVPVYQSESEAGCCCAGAPDTGGGYY